MALTRIGGANAISGTIPQGNIANASLGAVTALPAAISTGSMVLLQTTTASNVSSVTMGSSSLLDNTYKAYKIIGSNVVPASDGVNGHARISIGGSVKSDAYYRRCRIRMYDGSATVSGYANTDMNTMGNYFGESIGSASGENVNFESIVYDPSNTSSHTFFSVMTAGQDLSPNSQLQLIEFVYTNSTAAVDGVQFYFSSGNIESGTFKLYGLS
jgi:hypothetical protein